jgi:hypothetical protein
VKLKAIIAVGAALVALAACSSSTPTANKKDVNAVAASIGNGSQITKKQASCVASHAVPKLTKKDLTEFKKTNADLTKLSKSDQTEVWDSFSACLTVLQLAPSIAAAGQSTGGKVPAKSEKCYEKALTTGYKTSGDVMKALVGHSTTLQKALTQCVSPADVKQALINVLQSSVGLTAPQATCVVNKLIGSMSAADLTKLLESGPSSTNLQTQLTADESACAGAK